MNVIYRCCSVPMSSGNSGVTRIFGNLMVLCESSGFDGVIALWLWCMVYTMKIKKMNKLNGNCLQL